MSTLAAATRSAQAGSSQEPPNSSLAAPQPSTNFTVVDHPSATNHRRTCSTLALSVTRAWASVVTYALGVLAWFQRDEASENSTTTLLSKLQTLWTSKYDLIGKTIVLITLIVACLALWPSFAASGDSRKALSLAQWDAKKEFFELCESHNWNLLGCNDTIKNSLGPPPVHRSNGSVAKSNNYLDGNSTAMDVGSISALVAFTSCCIVALLRRRVIRQNLLQFCAKLTRQDINGLLHERQSHTNRELQGLGEPLPVVFGTSSSFDFTFGLYGPPQDLSHAATDVPHLLRHRRNARPESAETSLNNLGILTSSQPVPVQPAKAYQLELELPMKGPSFSPFTDREDLLDVLTAPQYVRPKDGLVNGYLKFSWPSRRPVLRTSSQLLNGAQEAMTNPAQLSGATYNAAPIEPVSTPSVVLNEPMMSCVRSSADTSTASSISPRQSPLQAMATCQPKPLMPLFGLEARMDRLDRRLFEFYIKIWCPGRSAFTNTNPWLRDLAPMYKHEGVLCAMQSLAGIYVYDYLQDERIRQRINERYMTAVTCFRGLLLDPKCKETGGGDEVVSMAILLSMKDTILIERRLKKPHPPRWLNGFKHGEFFLQETDPGRQGRNSPYSRLRISQSIIVSQAIVLTQFLMALPSLEVAKLEDSRQSWLLYGTERDVLEIHGGCGFSKKLLHSMSQVTCHAVRLQKEPESAHITITTLSLYRDLLEMKQWSHEGSMRENTQTHSQPIEWLRSKPDDILINSTPGMIDATSEAWRITTIIYLQCRLLRLPRNHPEVIASLRDLSKCIGLMPTSGSHFTAEAPLLPAFLLGMLATVPRHRDISQNWFEHVLQTPVRSSVPPLYQALRRIWSWIDTDIEVPSVPTELPGQISGRIPWWENLVSNIDQREDEILCFV